MPSIFTRIIAGELPAHFVFKDDRCVVFLSIHPITRGHALVVPRDEVDHWIDLAPALAAHLMTVARAVGKALCEGLGASRVGLMIAGLEVPHTHLHVLPIRSEADLDFARADPSPDPEDLAEVARRLRAALGAGPEGEVPASG